MIGSKWKERKIPWNRFESISYFVKIETVSTHPRAPVSDEGQECAYVFNEIQIVFGLCLVCRMHASIQLSRENRTHVGIRCVTFYEFFVDPIIIRLVDYVPIVIKNILIIKELTRSRSNFLNSLLLRLLSLFSRVFFYLLYARCFLSFHEITWTSASILFTYSSLVSTKLIDTYSEIHFEYLSQENLDEAKIRWKSSIKILRFQLCFLVIIN